MYGISMGIQSSGRPFRCCVWHHAAYWYEESVFSYKSRVLLWQPIVLLASILSLASPSQSFSFASSLFSQIYDSVFFSQTDLLETRGGKGDCSDLGSFNCVSSDFSIAVYFSVWRERVKTSQILLSNIYRGLSTMTMGKIRGFD